MDGLRASVTYGAGQISIRFSGFTPGKHRLVLQVSDYQEKKNSESVAGVLPNTRVLRTSFSVS